MKNLIHKKKWLYYELTITGDDSDYDISEEEK